MTKITASVFASSLLALGLYAAPAHALNTRSFISANGLDTNACTRTAPCRTLQKAHDSTNPSGEINMPILLVTALWSSPKQSAL